jgi:hypothetical protein
VLRMTNTFLVYELIILRVDLVGIKRLTFTQVYKKRLKVCLVELVVIIGSSQCTEHVVLTEPVELFFGFEYLRNVVNLRGVANALARNFRAVTVLGAPVPVVQFDVGGFVVEVKTGAAEVTGVTEVNMLHSGKGHVCYMVVESALIKILVLFFQLGVLRKLQWFVVLPHDVLQCRNFNSNCLQVLG